jgi:erythromycin esterase
MMHAHKTHADKTPKFASLDEWLAREAIEFSLASPEGLAAAVDRMMAAIGDEVRVLALGEALHGGEELLVLRNRVFARLVERHGFSAIALESSFPRGHLVNEYVGGGVSDALDDVMARGVSHGMGALVANRELVAWLHDYNASVGSSAMSDGGIVHFYGFDSPTEMMYTDSPRRLVEFALDYLAAVDGAAHAKAARVAELLGEDGPWENQAANMDPTKSIGRSDAAAALRVDVEDLIAEMRRREIELSAASGVERFLEALQHAEGARGLLAYHAVMADGAADRMSVGLGMRDLMMADNVQAIAERERAAGRGRVFVFAHNSHVKVQQASWEWGPQRWVWWPAGAHLRARLGAAYSVIGTAVGVSEENGIGVPEEGTLESRLMAAAGIDAGDAAARFAPTHGGKQVPAEALAALPVRTGSQKNPGYFPHTAESFADYDWLAAVDRVTYQRGGPKLG